MARIAIEARALSAAGGGVRTYARNLLRGILARKTPHTYHVYYDTARPRGTAPGASEHVVPVGHPLLRIIWDTWLLPAALRRDAVDLVHYIKPATTPFGKPLAIATVHDIIPLVLPDTQTFVQRMYWERQLPLVARECARILAVSEQTKRDLMTRLGVPGERITVTPLGVGERFRPAHAAEVSRVRKAYALPERCILYLGTIEPRKNVARLLRAFARISHRIPHGLVIAGAWGWRYDDVRDAARDPRIRDRVRFLASVSDADLPALYSAADVFAFPSLYEGFGLPPLEAMACGTPVVVSDTSSLPEVVGPHGMCVPPEDEEKIAEALERIITDRCLHDRLSREGIAWARRFTWEKTVDGTLAAYENALTA